MFYSELGDLRLDVGDNPFCASAIAIRFVSSAPMTKRPHVSMQAMGFRSLIDLAAESCSLERNRSTAAKRISDLGPVAVAQDAKLLD